MAIVLIAAALIGGGFFVVRRIMRPPTQASLDQGRTSAEAFLDLVREGKAGEAWDAATAEFKSIEGRESFMRKVKGADILREPLSFTSMQKVTVSDSPRSEFLYTSTKGGGTVRVLVGYEGGAWKVDRLIP